MKDYIFSTTGLLATLLAYLLSQLLKIDSVSSLMWLILILGVDVSHVYSTVYRTYFNSQQRLQLGKVLILVPLFVFFLSLGLALYSAQLFWTVLAYIAIFHFSRQQIGFLRWLQIPSGYPKLILEAGVYLSTLGSVFIWHLQGPKNFNWFVAQDLIYLNEISNIDIISLSNLSRSVVVGGSIAAFAFSLILFFQKKVTIHIPFILVSTFSSWYFPIVVLNSDFVFSVSNVIAHGIPYMTLVWGEEHRTKSAFRQIELFLGIILIMALVEEGFWDALVWREHSEFFESFYFLPKMNPTSLGLSVVLAVLILPQLTHYILDGFIWKKKYRQTTN